MITIRTLLGVLVFGLVFSFGLITFAKTPDGVTPAEETDCDGLSGAAYGLCNAFCEAQDCDLEFPDLSNSCSQLLDNYVDKTGFPGPPCVCREICGADHDACIDDCRVERDSCLTSCPSGPAGASCRDDCQEDGAECRDVCNDVRDECRQACREQERDACPRPE